FWSNKICRSLCEWPTTSTSSRAAESCTRAPRTCSGATTRSSRGISDCEGNRMKRIAVVGVGLLGSAVASRLLAGGFTLTGYDIRPDGLGRLGGPGHRAAATLRDAGEGAEAG